MGNDAGAAKRDDSLPATRAVALPSGRGQIRCMYDLATGPESAVIMVGGGDGGLDGPAEKLYPDLAQDLQGWGTGALRLDFRIHRFPGDIEEAVHDVREGVRFLTGEGYRQIGLLGHSFGGAVMIEAAADDKSVASVATLATQTAGAQRVAELAPRPILLVHGLADVRLTPECSRLLYRLAGEPKRLVLLEGATHSLRQRREEVRRLLADWFAETLGRRPGG